MKFFIAFSVALIASVHAIPAGIVNTGASAVTRSDDGYGNYAFGYNEDSLGGGTFRQEKGGPGVQVGSYGLREADGRVRTVNYVADALGFRASISTNEPGVDPKQDPAAVSLNGAAIPVIAPVLAAPAYAAGPILNQGYGAPILNQGYGAPIVNQGYAAPILAGPAATTYSTVSRQLAPVGYATQSVVSAPLQGYGVAAPGYGGYGKY